VQRLPHHYTVAARAAAEGEITLESAGLAPLASAPPAEFGGPGDRWSPETLLVGALADCFLLTFRAVARAAQLPWLALRCEVEGTLDRIERTTQFTAFRVRASLEVPPGTDLEEARRLLERSERGCLISSSLKATPKLEPEVRVRG
jgi:organic hydroperoxide reductase OsmC/OhrA